MIALAAVLLLTDVAGTSSGEAAKCDLPAAANMAEIYTMLSGRAVDAVDRVRRRGWERDPKLAAMVATTADFSLGASDVGRPFGKGIQALRAMALMLRADRFRYSGWSGTPPPTTSPCGEWQMDVEFIDGKTNTTSTIKFSFRDGLIMSASGWEGVFADGPVDAIER